MERTWPNPTGRPRRASATLEEVATLAGVSRATVSRVVNGSPRVSPRRPPSTSRRPSTELGYVPNRAARSLVTRRSDSIAVVITEPTGRLFNDPFFPRLLRGISSALAARDLQLVLLMPDDSPDEARTGDYLDRRPRRRRILVSLHGDDPLPDRLAAAGVPFVVVGRPPRGTEAELRRRRQPRRRPVGRGATSSPAAGESSRRSPARRTWPPAWTGSPATAMRSPRPVPRPPTRRSWPPATSPRTAAPPRWSGCSRPRPDIDAVFAASDLMAVGALSVLAAAGRRVPDDVAIVGYDDSPVATTTRPPAHQRPPADRGDGPRDGPPAYRCRRGLGSSPA